MPSFANTVLAGLIVIVAYVVKGFSGFGPSLITMPLFALFLDIKFAVPVGAILSLIAGLVLFFSSWRYIDIKSILVLMCGLLLGTISGTSFLIYSDPNVLKKIFGIFVAIFSINMLMAKDKVKYGSIKGWWGFLSGFLGGCAGGLFNTNGPPIVIYLSYKIKNKESLRATIIGVTFFDTVFRNLLYAASGLFQREILKFALFLIPPLAVGLGAGLILNIKAEEKLFRNIITTILLVTGILLLL